MVVHNMLFGSHPVADSALEMLGIDRDSVPRFRDAYFAWADETNSDPVIVVHTRTGGGNRDFYDEPNDRNPEGPWNSNLRELPGYRHDTDSDFDWTYADFFFDVPEEAKGVVVKYLSENGQPPAAEEKWSAAFAAISAISPKSTLIVCSQDHRENS